MPWAPQDRKAPKDPPVPLVIRAHKAPKVSQVQQALRVPKAQQGPPVLRAHLVLLVPKDSEAQKDSEAPRDRRGQVGTCMDSR